MFDPRSLYERALIERRGKLSGNYHNNVPMAVADVGEVVVRVPIDGMDVRDLRIWPEHQTLAVLGPLLAGLPRLLHHSESPRFQVQAFIGGAVLDELAPRGTRVPAHVIGDVVELMAGLCRVPQDRLPPAPDWWPGTGPAFGRLVSGATGHVVETVRAGAYAELYDRLGIPAAPLAVLDGLWSGLAARRFAPIHCDLHRKNMIVRGGRTRFLDWELCLLHGDPVYDLAIHLTKMGYLADEEDDLLGRWAEAVPAECSAGWSHDLPVYRAHERIKAAVVDSVRYTKLIAAGDTAGRGTMIASLTGKLNAAHEVWATGISLGREAVEKAVAAVLASPPPFLSAWTPLRHPASSPRRPAIGGGPSP
ncbi:phosphotransferase family protein [Nonomuraea sp. NPDC050153]|uniref:phosphotransferase family protein n=1 Tax=Nonomuraea sp. NPDC050153 TaxID=3364359 RepID=UPI0037A3E648